MSEFTEADKDKVLSVLTKITEEDKEKYHAYHDIYHVLKDSCDCRIPENKILPEHKPNQGSHCHNRGRCTNKNAKSKDKDATPKKMQRSQMHWW
jgi:hypothetical protein